MVVVSWLKIEKVGSNENIDRKIYEKKEKYYIFSGFALKQIFCLFLGSLSTVPISAKKFCIFLGRLLTCFFA
jgi:hypothetical protein